MEDQLKKIKVNQDIVKKDQEIRYPIIMIMEQRAHNCTNVEIDELVQKDVGLMTQSLKLRKTLRHVKL